MWDMIKIHNNYDKIGISTLVWYSVRVYVQYKASMMVDHCIQNPLKHVGYITTNIQNVGSKGHKCYILLQSQGIFYMHTVPIVVDNCTKYEQNQPILSEISQQRHKR